MKMLLIFITLGFYFNAWEKKKKNKAKSANYWPSTVLFVQKLRKQTNKKKNPGFADHSQLRGSGYRYFLFLHMSFKN